MPVYDRMTTYTAPAEAVRLAVAYGAYTSQLVARPEQGRALARIDQRLHVFQWSSFPNETRLRYWLRDDVPGPLEEIVDDPSIYDAPPASITDGERADADARMKRIRAAVTKIEPNAGDSTPPAPIGMRGVFLWTAFLGIAGVLVAALNWRRMNRRELFWPTVVLGVAVYPTFALALRMAVDSGSGSVLYAGLALIAYGTICGALLVRWQRPTFERWVQTNGRPTRADQRAGCGFIIALLFVSFVVSFVAGVGYLALTGTSLDMLLSRSGPIPMVPVTASGLSLQAPSNWVHTNLLDRYAAQCINKDRQQCVLALKRNDGSAFIMVMRLSDVVLHRSLAAAEQIIVDSYLQHNAGKIEVGEPEQVKIDNHRTIQRLLHFQADHVNMKTLFIEESTYSYLYLLAIVPESDATAGAEVTRMIASLHIEAGYSDFVPTLIPARPSQNT